MNRISLGVQSLIDKDLKFLGRNHSAKESAEAIEIAKSLFERVSFDLIYARNSDQTIESWKHELEEALNFDTGHISLYNLTIEPNTMCCLIIDLTIGFLVYSR